MGPLKQHMHEFLAEPPKLVFCKAISIGM